MESAVSFERRSASQKKRFSNPLERMKVGEANKGKIRSPESKERLSMSRIGCNNPNFGRRHTDSAKEIMSLHQKGEKHYNWRGGISYEPYCLLFNNAFKERVRLFFRRRCVECGKLESENWMRWGSQFKLVKLHVHHVKYDKKTCCKEGEPVGDRKFVTLCFTCHPRTNHNRKHWEMRYQEVIALEYGGKCYLTEEEYCNLNRI